MKAWTTQEDSSQQQGLERIDVNKQLRFSIYLGFEKEKKNDIKIEIWHMFFTAYQVVCSRKKVLQEIISPGEGSENLEVFDENLLNGIDNVQNECLWQWMRTY